MIIALGCLIIAALCALGSLFMLVVFDDGGPTS